MLEFTWLGHACWSIATGKHLILVDPFLDASPTAPVKANSVKPDFILVTHGHFDHISDAVAIAKRTGATVVTNFEISEWLSKQGVQDVVGMNHGGAIKLPFGRVKYTIAYHSSVLPDGTYGGNPGGFLLTLGEKNIYIAGDTALFSDMKLYGGNLELAIVPIGDLYTMGPEDSIEAVKLLSPKRVLPSHYDTWPPIEQDANAWAEMVRSTTGAQAEVLQPGQSLKL